MVEYSEGLSEDAVCALWEGTQRAEQGDIAWVAVLNLAYQTQSHMEPLQTISHDELVKQQTKDKQYIPNRERERKSRHRHKETLKGMEQAAHSGWPTLQENHWSQTTGSASHL